MSLLLREQGGHLQLEDASGFLATDLDVALKLALSTTGLVTAKAPGEASRRGETRDLDRFGWSAEPE